MNFVHFLFALAQLQRKRGGAVGAVDMCNEFGFKRGTANMYINQLVANDYLSRISRGKYIVNCHDITLAFGLLVVTPLDVYLENSGDSTWEVD